jgi:hypothetical protein
MPESISQITDIPKGRDTPPHMMDDSIFEQPKLEIGLELFPISGLIFDGDAPENLRKGLYSTDELPGLYTSQDCNQPQAKARIVRAVELGYDYLRQGKLRKSAELTRSILKRPRFQEVILGLEELFSEFQVLHDFTEIKGISPKECHLSSISKKLSTLRAEAKDYLVAEGLAVPRPPLWGKDNDLTEWWSANDFEILSACYRHKVEIFLKIVAPYFPKAQDLYNDGFPEIHTPTGKSAPLSSVTELPPPWKFRSAQEEPHNCFRLPPLSTITSGRNLARLISNEPIDSSEKEINSDYGPRGPSNNWEFSNSQFPYRKANVNLVGWLKNIRTPQFTKDDKNVLPRRTPESIGAQPCRHCNSGFHWDNECKHSRKGEKMARVNSIQLEDNNL